jgi:hypothetical protein
VAAEDALLAVCPDVLPILDDPLIDDDHQLWHMGALIGVVNVVDCITYNPNSPADRKRLLALCHKLGVRSASKKGGDTALLAFAEGPWCWLCKDAVEFTRPIRASGKLNLWKLSGEQRAAVAEAMEAAGKRKGRPRPCQPVWISNNSDITVEKRKRAKVSK